MCQNVQPLQLGAFWTAAPTWWIEPRCGPHTSVPSAMTVAATRRCRSVSTVPGATRPRSTRLPKETRGASRRVGVASIASSGAASAGGCGPRRPPHRPGWRSMPTKWRCRRLATAADVPLPRKGSRMTSPGHGAGQQDPVQQRLRLLRRVQLQAVLVAQPLLAGAQRDQPVAAHLQIVVQRLHRSVVEAVAAVLLARRPDQRLVRVGEAAAAEVRHRVGFAPDHVVEDPESQVLQDGADAEDVVVAADHPQRAVLAQHAPRLGQPRAGEGVVGGEIGELVPVVVHRHRPGCRPAGAARPAIAGCRAGRRRRSGPTRPAACASSRTQSPRSIWSRGRSRGDVQGLAGSRCGRTAATVKIAPHPRQPTSAEAWRAGYIIGSLARMTRGIGQDC